ncbi:Rhodanese- sulfurtransferase [Coniosporium apollinis]|uniref:Ribosome biogenesis regulatory protein n=1 Tax=Coniosporium apollinis TaxID=61459 RepID=A0ABQ9NIT5_9PEZI|nr:Rhodanese- sulfurtransferase [Coniosporium apollinis]
MDTSTAPQADLSMTDEALIAAEDAPSTTVEALMTDTANPDALEPHSKSVANNHIKSSQPMSSYQTAPETHDEDADMVDAAEEDDTPDGGVKLPAESTEPSMNGDAGDKRPSIHVTKPTPYTFDLGHLLCIDPNPLPPHPTEAILAATARDCAQALINQLLTTCAITSTAEGVHLNLPAPETRLPREKAVPAEKEPTKWEKFAQKKGIKDKKKEGKLVYDEASGEWVPKWGYKGKNKEGENDWLVEVDDKKERDTGEAGDARKAGREERKERVKRNERKQRANERKSTKGRVG